MGACTLTPGNYCARLMNSIIGLGVSMSLAPFVCRERDGIALGGTQGGRKRDGGRGEVGKGLVGETEEEARGKNEHIRRKGREEQEGRKEGDKGKASMKRGVSACFRQIKATWNNSEIKLKTKREKNPVGI